MGKLHIIDVSTVCGYLVLCLIIGVYKSTKVKDIKDYTVGDKNFSTFAIIATLFATYISAQYVLGKSGKIHELGLLFVIPFLMQPFVWITTSFFFTKNIRNFKKHISVVDIMSSLYGKSGRYITAISSLLFSIAVLSVQTTALAYLGNYFFGISYNTGAFIGIGMVVIYSVLGGVRSVVSTDIFQFTVFFLVLPIACGYAYFSVGGYENIITKLPETHLEIEFTKNNIRFMLGMLGLFLMPFIEASYCQRLLIAKDTQQLVKSLRLILVCAFLVTIVTCTIGYIVRSQYPDINSHLTFYYFIEHFLFTGLKGFVIVGFLAVIQSSADSWINTSSSIIAKDVIQPLFKNKLTKKELLSIARCGAVFITFSALFISLISKQILELIWLVNNFNFPVLFIPLVFGFRGFKTNERTFISSVIIGVVFVILARMYTGQFEVESSIFGVIGSAIGFFFAHYWQVARGIIKIEKPLYAIHKPSLMEKIKQTIRYFITIKRQLEGSKSAYYSLALYIMSLNIPILILSYYPAVDIVNIIAQYLRYTTLFLGILIMLHELLFIRSNITFIWNTVLFLSLPFTGAYLFIASGYGVMWGVNFFLLIVAIFMFANLFYAWILAVLGIATAIFTYNGLNWWTNSKMVLHPHIDTIYFSAYSVAVIAVVVTSVTCHRFKKNRAEKKALGTLGNSIAHDMKSPLKNNLMALEMVKQALKRKNYDSVAMYIDELGKFNTQAIQDVNIMLSAMSETQDKPDDWGEYSATECIKNTISEYYMDDNEKERLAFLDIGKDFCFTGSKTLLRHIMNNLIKNAFKYAGSKAKIEIFIVDDEIHIRDNGCGMKQEILDNIFEKYVTTGGYGIGLSFSKEAMKKMDGDIECYSAEGEGTEFVLRFS